MDLEKIQAVALEAARAAGDILLRSFEDLESGSVTRKSSRRDLVSAADVAAEREIVKHLRAAFPEHAIEAEEEVKDAREDDRPRWFVDPLDGTVNFVQGLPMFCVSLGLYVGGVPKVSVVHAPVLGETFTATAGNGGLLQSRGKSRALRVTDKQELSESILATGFPYLREQLVPNNSENFQRFFLQLRGIRRMGSAALDLAYVAAGRLDGYWELYLSPHDVAGGALLVREAGGIVTDSQGGEQWLRRGDVVASGPGIHSAIQSQVLSPDPKWPNHLTT